jgi:hypothetical protein
MKQNTAEGAHTVTLHINLNVGMDTDDLFYAKWVITLKCFVRCAVGGDCHIVV